MVVREGLACFLLLPERQYSVAVAVAAGATKLLITYRESVV
jgi:hypothetical protein